MEDKKIPYLTSEDLADAGLKIRPSRIWEMSDSARRCIAGQHHWLPVPGDEQPSDATLLRCKHCPARKEAESDDEY